MVLLRHCALYKVTYLLNSFIVHLTRDLCRPVNWSAGTLCVGGGAVEPKSSSGVNSLEALGKSVLEQSLAKVTTVADWKTQSSTVTLVITLSVCLSVYRAFIGVDFVAPAADSSFHVAWTTATHFLTAYQMHRWPGYQNAVAHLVLGIWKYDHITAVLRQLHWLPVWKRVDFKIVTLVYRSLSGMAPAYLAADCQLSSEEGRRHLRSADSRTCVVRQTCDNFGDRRFVAAGPRLWDSSLPAGLRQTDIGYEQFKRVLKTWCNKNDSNDTENIVAR